MTASPLAIAQAIREVRGEPAGDIPLHAPVFGGHEAAYVQATIDSTFVSTVGAYVGRFEEMLRAITGARHAVATVNGTTALHVALMLAGLAPGEMAITQSLSFAATANAIAHAGGVPAFVDVERASLGMSPSALQAFLEGACERAAGGVRHSATGRRVAAVVPMHTFGHPAPILELLAVCDAWGLPMVEDAAEALGSTTQGQACGTFGLLGTLSFNGNKVVTCGGGGAILTDDEALGRRAKHLTTTAKRPHRWRFEHDEVGYNFRMPNLNAALGCAQLERLEEFVAYKRRLADDYRRRFEAMGVPFLTEPSNGRSIYWLCAILAGDEAERDAILEATNDAGVMTRPIWEPLHTLPMYADAPRGPLPVTAEMAARLVNIPSGFREAAAAAPAEAAWPAR